MTRREDQVDAVARLLNGDDRADRAVAWLLAQQVVDAVLPQITTVEQLDALPTRTVLIDCDGEPWQRFADGDWQSPVDDGPLDSPGLAQFGPLTVVWQP